MPPQASNIPNPDMLNSLAQESQEPQETREAQGLAGYNQEQAVHEAHAALAAAFDAAAREQQTAQTQAEVQTLSPNGHEAAPDRPVAASLSQVALRGQLQRPPMANAAGFSERVAGVLDATDGLFDRIGIGKE